MYNSIKKLSFAVLIILMPLLAQSDVDLGDIKNSLVCNCECGMTVSACEGAMSCGTAKKLTDEARIYLNYGLSKDAILGAFVERYGEEILAAPTKKGFNLVAWILPFAVLGTVGLGIGLLIRKWAKKSASIKNDTQDHPTTKIDDNYENQLDDILREIE